MNKTAYLIIAHGTRDEAGQESFRDFVKAFAVDTRQAIVEHGFLELAEPSIPEGLAKCVAQEATEIILMPMLFFPGKHLNQDLPAILMEARTKYPGVQIMLGGALALEKDGTAADKRLFGLMRAKANEAMVTEADDSRAAPKVLHEGKFKRLLTHDGWEYVERVKCGGIVVILALTPENKVLFVEQPRIPIRANCIEFPAGLASDTEEFQGESLETAARRELIEETGYEAQSFQVILEGPASSSSSSDILTVFYAEDLTKVGEGGGDETESIIVHEVELDHIEAWLAEKTAEGCHYDPKIYAGIYWLRKHRGEIQKAIQK